MRTVNIEDSRTCLRSATWERQHIWVLAGDLTAGSYVKTNSHGIQKAVLAFQGTDPEMDQDWPVNIQQGLPLPLLTPKPYLEAVEVWRREAQDGAGSMAGHSLGGGLSQFAAGADGAEAYIYNPAGLGLVSIIVLNIAGNIPVSQVIAFRSLGYQPKDDGTGVGTVTFRDLVSAFNFDLADPVIDVLVEVPDYSSISDRFLRQTIENLFGQFSPQVRISQGNVAINELHSISELKNAIALRTVLVNATLTYTLYYEYLLADNVRVVQGLERLQPIYSSNPSLFQESLNYALGVLKAGFYDALTDVRDRYLEIAGQASSMTYLEQARDFYALKNVIKSRGAELRQLAATEINKTSLYLPEAKREAFVRSVLDGGFEPNWVHPDFNLCDETAPAAPTAADLAIALVLDVSGSMQEENRLARAVAAAKANIQAMDDDTVMSISAFSSSSRVVMSNTAAVTARQSSNAALDSLRPLQRTNIESGLNDGYGQLIASTAANCAIILLTDGANNIGDPARAVARFNSRTGGCGVSIESVGLGQDADATALTALSASTGGSYWPASSSNVGSIYQRIAAKVRNESTILDSTDMLGAGDTVELDMTIAPGTTSLGGSTSWQGSTLQATLVDPEGNDLAEEDILAAKGRYEVSGTTALLTLPNPAPGNWKVRLHWLDPPAQPEAVSIVMTDRSAIATNFLAFKPEYKEGQVVNVRVQAAEVMNSGRIPLKEASVSVEIQLPPGAGSSSGLGGGTGNPLLKTKKPGLLRGASVPKPTVIRSLDLSLEPSDPAAKSIDASFSAEFLESGYPGPYIVRATIRGKLSDGTPVEKVINSSFQVGPLESNSVRTSAMHNALLRTKRNAALHGKQGSGGGLLKASKPKNPLLH